MIETDSFLIYNLVAGDTGRNERLNPLVVDGKCILREEPNFKIKHVLREANRCADWMGNWVLEEPPDGVLPYLFHDSMGISIPRVML